MASKFWFLLISTFKVVKELHLKQRRILLVYIIYWLNLFETNILWVISRHNYNYLRISISERYHDHPIRRVSTFSNQLFENLLILKDNLTPPPPPSPPLPFPPPFFWYSHANGLHSRHVGVIEFETPTMQSFGSHCWIEAWSEGKYDHME